MSGLFAAYDPRAGGSQCSGPPEALSIQPMEDADVDEVAAIRSERNGGSLGEAVVWARSSLSRRSRAPDGLEVLVARIGAEAVGYGCVVRLAPTPTAPRNAIPTGLYLGGVVVRARHRRRGVARELTARRLTWIYARSDSAYYFANSTNRASHDLHVEFGFGEVRRGIWAPGVLFQGGEGVLYLARRPAG